NDSPNHQPMPHCPVCNAIVYLRDASNQPATPTAPFCSDRCKNIDLGRWLDESYGIPDDAKECDDDDGESYGERY
ncbi:MAG: DNA gyrase inhibitor YacG, partial [Vicinamibacterales bacterium]